ncbi:unnamed protein product [Adineta steineri]|uniref:EF-hand domain-containing protein n=1 Tax=Adineta steineri TaxID=433720 RepID=A0A815CT88_9BILA|nr:unnamed protein product [Adineta steineri]
MKSLFRSRLPAPLETAQTKRLSKQFHLPEEEIEEWYERFQHCYPRGLSSKEFVFYLQQIQIKNGKDKRPTKSIVKRLFRLLDINQDKQLDFEEFFQFNILINQGSSENKLKLILSLYDKDKQKYLTRQQLENVLINMFDLLDIPIPNNGLSERINTILTRGNFNNQNSKISWHAFRTHILDNSSSFDLLVSNDDWDYLITRF